MKRRLVIQTLGTWAALSTSSVRAATSVSTGTRRLAALLFDNPESWNAVAQELREELVKLGWVEGRNFSMEWYFANGDTARLAELASGIGRSGVDAIFTRGTPATRALQQATRVIPIVTGVGDPIGAGFAKSLSQPGSNITGLSYAAVEINRKQVELLRAVVPKLSRVNFVLKADRSPFVQEMMNSYASGARELGLDTEVVLVTGIADLQRAWQLDRHRGVSAAVVSGLGKDIAPRGVADLALRLRMPTAFEYSFYVDAGGLLSYRLNWENQTARIAVQLDKVLRGVHPAQIPFEFPTHSELVINRSTARSLGLEIPRALLVSADKLID